MRAKSLPSEKTAGSSAEARANREALEILSSASGSGGDNGFTR